MKKNLIERHEAHLCNGMVLKTISDVLMICNDNIDDNICAWEYAQTYIGHTGFYHFLCKLGSIKCIGGPFRRYVIKS